LVKVVVGKPLMNIENAGSSSKST